MRDGLAMQQDVLRSSVEAAAISYLSTRMDMHDARTYRSVREGDSYMTLTVCTRDGSRNCERCGLDAIKITHMANPRAPKQYEER